MAAPQTVPALDLPTRTNGRGDYPTPHADEAMYAAMYKQSLENPVQFWDKVRAVLVFPSPLGISLRLAG